MVEEETVPTELEVIAQINLIIIKLLIIKMAMNKVFACSREFIHACVIKTFVTVKHIGSDVKQITKGSQTNAFQSQHCNESKISTII